MATSGGGGGAGFCPDFPTSPAAGSSVEVLQWLRNLPQAPEYRPTLAEFQDPIAYIFKIEKEASKYGICKIVPPVLPASKKTAMANLNKSLAARAAGSASASESSASKSSPTFTTRQQQIGFCPRKPRPVQKPVWQSGENYTFQEFEAKARAFEKHYLKRYSKKGALSPLEIETLYWKATLDKPFSVEYANDMPGSAFSPKKSGGKEKVVAEGMSVGETEWNMRGVSRAKGSLLRFMKEEIPGVTSPMLYVAMMFSWFAWHVEDHDFHSLNYLHMGAGKTWYGVPRDAAVAFEEVVRVHGYGGEINPLVTFAVLGEKTTVMSPETFVRAGVPCCRLVQNAGDFVVTFPRAYHSGFSHGFNCGEAANIATPEWLTVAKDAAIRRASINYPPMVSHFQLLYDLAIEFSTRVPQSISAKPRSSRLKDKQSGEGEKLVKQHFVMNLMQNNDLLHLLGKRSPIVLLPRSSSDISVCSNLRVGSQLRGNSSLDMCSFRSLVKSSEGSVPDDIMQDRKPGISQVKSFISVKGKFATLCERNRFSSLDGNDNMTSTNTGSDHADKLSDQRLFSCVTCGILTFDCVAVVQPREDAARYLMSSDCGFFNDWTVGSGVPTARFGLAQDANTSQQNFSTRWMENNRVGGIYDVPVQSANYQTQSVDRSSQVAPIAETHRDSGALGLLALNYGNSSDSDEDQVEPRMSHCSDEINVTACSPESKNQSQISVLASHKEESHDDGTGNHHLSPSRLNCKEEDPGQAVDLHAEQGCKPDDFNHGSDPVRCSMEMETNAHAPSESNCLGVIDARPMSHTTSDNPPVLHDTEKPKFSRAILPMENTNMSFVLRSDEDSSRMHVFCLEHAVEVEQQLRPIGGVDILLLCHPEYPRIEAEAKLVSEELGIEYLWNDIAFRDANKEDEERIQSALDSEEAIPGNGDWAVKLGINLFYSVSLSWSPLYTKQMAYNSVIYEAFGRSSPASSPRENIYARKSSKQKKVVAGKWCGKVWMSNQVHPLLAKQDSMGDDLEHEQEGSFNCRAVPDEKPKRKQQSINKKETTSSARKFARKRKTTADCGPVKKVKRLDTEDAASADDSRQQPERNCKSKHVKSVEREDEMSNISDADTSLQQYRRILRSKRAQSNQRKNAISYALTTNKIGKQRQIISRGKQAKSVETEDAGSDEFLEDGTHWWQGKVPNSTRAKSSDGEDAVSDDSQEEGPHQARCWVPGSKQAKFVEEDAVSDDSLDNSSRRNRNTSRGNRANRIEREDATSDDPGDESTYKHLTRFARGKKAKFNESEDASSDDSLEDNARQQPGRTRSGRRDKVVESEGAVPDDLLEQLRHMRMARNKKSKGIREEDFISDDLREDSSHRQPKKTPRDKQGKFIGRKDAVSDDEDNSDQQHGRVLRSKLGSKKRKPTTPRQMKHETPRQLKPGARPLAKKETKQSVKRERQVKQMALQVRNDKNDQNVRNADSHSEEVEGGPSSRLRKRPSKTSKEMGKKVKEKQQTDSKKAKNALVAKSFRGNKTLKKKDEEAEHRCNIDGCTMSFRSKQELAMHKRNVCPVKGCGKKFFSHKYLVQHRRVHIDDRPLKCPWKGCKKTFKWAWARTEHIRVHTGARPYICAEDGCGQTFRFVSDFSRHKRKTGHSIKTSNH